MADSGRGQVLIPWPNRLDHGRYVWDGQSQQVPINEIERSNAIHGLVRFAGWNCIEASAARVEMAHTLWPSPGYPFTLHIQIAYRVDDVGLTVTTTTRNAGTAPAPYGAGQHPYIVPPAGVSVDDCELLVPAKQYLETDHRGLPTAAHPVEGTPVDFTTSRPIGTLELDTAFTDLTPRSPGSGPRPAQRRWASDHALDGRGLPIRADLHRRYIVRASPTQEHRHRADDLPTQRARDRYRCRPALTG